MEKNNERGIRFFSPFIKRGRIIPQRTSERAEGPKIVIIGGGTGLSVILRGLKKITDHSTAIVTVTDDGGSSGRLLQGGITVPPGDIRNCLVALSPREGILEELFNYRFERPDELQGHCLGNLLITGLADIRGDMPGAIRAIAGILDIRGHVYPVTMDRVILSAVMKDGALIRGETAIVADARSIGEVFLEPKHCHVNEEAVEAILGADLVLLGPGSLYTSVIPNLLVPGIIDALLKTLAPVYYVANIMTQPGETDGYSLSDHLLAIARLSPAKFLDGVILNNNYDHISRESLAKYGEKGAAPVVNDGAAVKKLKLKKVELPLAREGDFVQHDADVLAQYLAKQLRV